jgi:hypothetical protein
VIITKVSETDTDVEVDVEGGETWVDVKMLMRGYIPGILGKC